MALSDNLQQRENDKFKEHESQTCIAVYVQNAEDIAASGGSGGTEYTEGATDSTITGTAILWEDSSDTLRAVSAAKPLPVSVVSGNTQYAEGGTAATITGTAMLWEDTSDTLRAVSAAKPLPVVQSVLGYIATASATVTRPADTTAYAAKDAVSNSTSSPSVITFSSMARSSGGSGYITKARLMTDQSTNTARFRLHLFHTSPTAINDNAAHTLLWANRANRIGFIDFDACSTEGSGSDAANSFKKDFAIPFTTSGSANIFGLLETLDAFTPASSQNIYIELTADQN